MDNLTTAVIYYHFSMGICVMMLIRQLWREWKEERENRKMPDDLERIFRWIDSLSSRRR